LFPIICTWTNIPDRSADYMKLSVQPQTESNSPLIRK
jgi:hypothetical protein